MHAREYSWNRSLFAEARGASKVRRKPPSSQAAEHRPRLRQLRDLPAVERNANFRCILLELVEGTSAEGISAYKRDAPA